ncbi:MAG: hypothetical protein CML67_09190 [Rhodobacteraceae bacterium]|jgi:uncharacterized membrane protein|uniref:DUF2177 family protein n=1 Tax=Stappia TaxID=152161 RepID=UPI000C37DFF5|nr:DUF2177 family protein [Stappia stellulata]MBB99695.1 hypothetical protein [Paracoccaceae bacterium]MCA1243895.1 DUF2177 family protein [Stappia stellulata]
MSYAIAYLATAVVFFAIDYVWLTRIAGSFYRDRVGALMADEVNFAVAGAFYTVYVVGIVIFAVSPALKSGNWQDALIYGLLFGFFAYATYDFTNLATLRDWPVVVTLVDVTWGTFVTGVSAWAGYMVARNFV